jgi:hypothetical protein
VPAFLSVSAEPPMRIATELPRALKLRDVTSEELDSGWGTLQIGRMNSESAVCFGQQTVVERTFEAGDSVEGEKREASGKLQRRQEQKKLETDHKIDVVPGTLKLLRSGRCARQAPPSVAYIDPAGEITPPGTSQSVATCAEELAGRGTRPLEATGGPELACSLPP